MTLTKDSLGLSESATVERQETDAILADPDTMAAIREGEAELTAGPRRADFPVGSYVRTRHALVDRPLPVLQEDEQIRPFDFGQVVDGQPDGEFVGVRWSQAGCGCAAAAQEDPASLVPLTPAEYALAVAAYHTGYNTGYDDAA